jgi:ribosome-binding protein aMBF1 (putative translation factor)
MMSEKTWLEKKVDLWADDPEFLTEEKILDFTERVVLEMDKKGISRVQLATSLGRSKAFVTKLLKGDANMTIKTMVTVAQALGCNLHLDLYPKGFCAHTLCIGDSSAFEPVDLSYLEDGQYACAA